MIKHKNRLHADTPINPGQGLRHQAEERLRENQKPEDRGQHTADDTSRLVHELQVHQIELEMQNEELQQARAKAETLLTQYIDLYDFAPTGYLAFDREGTIRQMNLTGALLLGIERSKLVQRRFGLFVAECDRCVFSDFLEKIFTGDAEKPSCEVSLSREDAQPLVVRIEGMRSEDGQECRAVVMDVTGRKRLETYREIGLDVLQILNDPGDMRDAIQRIISILKMGVGFDAVGLRLQDGVDFPYYAQQGFSTAFLQTENTLLERAADGGVCRDKDGNICLEGTCGLVISRKIDPANPLLTKGGSFWTNDSRPLLELPPGKDPRLHPRNRCILDGYASVALIPIRNKDRTVGLLQLNDRRKGSFTLEAVELLEGIAATIGLVLMRKKAEAERDKLQGELSQAQKMESVGRLAGGVAHDFNNMVMGIMGYVEICQDELPVGHPVRSYLDEITTISTRSADLIRKLLAFARKQVIEPKVMDLNDALSGMFKLLQRLIGEDISMIWMPGVNLWPVNIDPSQIDQILTNLCVNARDAIAGVGKITIGTTTATLDQTFCADHEGAVPGEYVVLNVSDTGCGMTKDVLANIFEPFFTTKEVGKGTGLGLSTVYGIVKQNNGWINVYSKPGKGTTFEIYLPRLVGEANKTTVAHVAEVPQGRGETILLVEDEYALRTICGRILATLGYKVLLAATPEEAITLVARHPGEIDLLFTDVIMPGMNGQALAKQLLAVRPGIKVLFMSGYTADVIAKNGLLDKGMDFIQKPATRDAVARKVREVLG